MIVIDNLRDQIGYEISNIKMRLSNLERYSKTLSETVENVNKSLLNIEAFESAIEKLKDKND